MINRHLILTFCTLQLCILASCSISRKGTAENNTAKMTDMESLISRTRLDGEWQALLFKGSADIDHPDYSGSVQLQLIWKKDSMIQIAVRKFGFEVSRLQIGTDSVTIVDRINHIWDRASVDQWASKYTSAGSFDCLQSLLVRGSCLPAVFDYRLEKGNEGLLNLTSDTMGLHWSSAFGARDLNPVMTEFNGQGVLLQAKVNAYSSLDDKTIPHQWQLSYRQADDFFSMRLNWSEIKPDPHPAFKLHIPSHYTRDKML